MVGVVEVSLEGELLEHEHERLQLLVLSENPLHQLHALQSEVLGVLNRNVDLLLQVLLAAEQLQHRNRGVLDVVRALDSDFFLAVK